VESILVVVESTLPGCDSFVEATLGSKPTYVWLRWWNGYTTIAHTIL